jgi:two-component system, NtrC family, sensor histidine kinase HydH
MASRASRPIGSPTRQFVVLSLLTIGGSTLLFGFALAYYVERGILDREWASTAALVRAAARFYLRPADFAPGGAADRRATVEASERFEEWSRQVRMLPEVLELRAYDARGSLLWSDTERRSAIRPPGANLPRALAGETAVRLQPAAGGVAERVELHAPIDFPGEGRVAGVVEAQVDGSRVLASVRRARLVLWSMALLTGAALYAAVYGIVWRASRTLRAQHASLGQRADELARANTELRTVQRDLVAAERFAAFGEITAAIAHGIANPLSAIRGTAQLAMMDTPPDGPDREAFQKIIADTDRLTVRMRALLDFGRPVEQRRVPTAVEAVVRPALDSIAHRAATQGVRLDIVITPELPKVRLDPARFEEALLCLLGNALDAMPGGGALRVTAVADGPAAPLDLVIEDTGPGIPEPVLARVFEPFFTTKAGGTGLGLAVARKLLDGAGARLRLESAPGRGTRAIVGLPREEP